MNKLLFLLFSIFSLNLGAQCLSSVTVETLAQDCQDNLFGEATITPNDGLSPFTYEWSGGTWTSGFPHTITGLILGNHTVTITDSNNCQIQETFTIEQNNIIVIIQDAFLCEGECAILDATASTGPCALLFEWSDQTGNIISNSPTIEICAPGSYICNATSSCDDCYTQEIIDVFQNEPMELNFTSLAEPTCGLCDGAISAQVSGGTPGYSFTWQLNGVVIGNSPDLSGLCEGLLEISVFDALGCQVQNEIELNCSGFTLETYFETTACANTCDAFTSAVPIGGEPPFEWIWSNGDFGETIYNLCPGVYEVTVVDASNSIQTASFNIVEQNPLTVDFISSPASCATGGIIEFVISQGSGDYTYLLDGAEVFTTTITGLPPGNANIEIIDNQTGCTHEETIVVGSPYDVAITATNTSCDMSDGTATASVPGGTSTYSYEWSNGDNNATATGLAPGGYSVTVTDNANNCVSHENILIEESSDCYVLISGYVINDEANTDCVLDMNPQTVAYHLIGLNNTQFTYTDENGFYHFQTEPGTHEITYETVDNLFFEPLCIDPITVTVSNFGDAAEDNNFFIEEIDVTDLHLYMHKTTIRPGFNHFLNATVYNFGTETVTGSFEVTHDPNQDFVSAQPAATNYDAATRIITWDYTNLNPNDLIQFQVTFNTPSTVALGTEITTIGIVSSFATDDYPDNNSKTCSKLVVGSYDPNDKQVSHDGDVWEVDENVVWAGSASQLNYLVRFQNTGTDTAFTVVIADELDELIDIRDIVPGPASHPYTLNVRAGNVLEFTFNNILLPDSTTNEAASHGYVYFDVNVNEQMTDGADIHNDAAIFFDFNTPIITNEVVTIFDMWLGDNEIEDPLQIRLSPNPTKDVTTLFYDLKESAKISIDLFDISGKIVQQIRMNDLLPSGLHQETINTSKFKNGTYFVRLRTSEVMITEKLVIIK